MSCGWFLPFLYFAFCGNTFYPLVVILKSFYGRLAEVFNVTCKGVFWFGLS